MHFEYDDENQLIRITSTNSWKTEFNYDGLLRRRIKKEYTWTGSAWSLTNQVRYICDGMLVLQERDGSNTPKVTYTRGPDLSSTFEGAGGIGGLLARTGNGNSTFYHNDGSGNVTALVDSQQFLAAQYLYDPFGNTLSMSGPLAEANTHRFSSKEAHVNSGLYYYGYRYYSPNLQRWINEDPIAEDGDINIHRFVFNDPVNWIDVDGLNGYNVPRPSPRPGYRGPITEELSGHIRRGSGRLTREEQFYENAMRHQWEKELARRHPGHKPGQSYICAPPRPAAPRGPVAAEERKDVQAPSSTPPPGIVYLRRNPVTGEEYIGRASSARHYLRRQRVHDRKLGVQHEYERLENFPPGESLRVGEESLIRERGGPQPQGPLANRRYEMNDQAFRNCGGLIPRPTK